LEDRRDLITQNIFREIKDPKHKIHYLLPPVQESHSQMILRPTYPYQLPLGKLTRYGRDSVPHLSFREVLLFLMNDGFHVVSVVKQLTISY